MIPFALPVIFGTRSEGLNELNGGNKILRIALSVVDLNRPLLAGTKSVCPQHFTPFHVLLDPLLFHSSLKINFMLQYFYQLQHFHVFPSVF
jgi:hypothetical protein